MLGGAVACVRSSGKYIGLAVLAVVEPVLWQSCREEGRHRRVGVFAGPWARFCC